MMPERSPSIISQALENWQTLLKQYKENLAKRLWSLPEVSEKEKEILYKECLTDLDAFEKELGALNEDLVSRQRVFKEENELLRSLMGVGDDDQRAKILNFGHEISALKKKLAEREAELDALRSQVTHSSEENQELRKTLREAEGKTDEVKAEQLRIRGDQIKAFSEEHQTLKIQLKDLTTRLSNLRELFTKTNEKLLIEKQDEISGLQKKLLEEMEETLRKKQELMWGEEEMFAKGIAHKVRTALVSAQGQLFLTLERLGLFDAESKTESFWKSRLRLLVEGGKELAQNFKQVQAQIHEVTATLDEYLHLTHRRELRKEPVSLKEVVEKIMAEIYVDRRPTLNIEVLSDDPLPEVIGDVTLLQFVFRTLLRNSIESLPGEMGKIIVALKNKSKDNCVEVTVQDEGEGIPEHLLPRLFEPFFTTKEKRQGLNLSRARRYVELHGGTLELVKTDKNGTMFEMVFPMMRP